jgi:hypothetical protein
MTDTKNYTRDIHGQLLSGLRALEEFLSNAQTQQKIEAGSILWEVGDALDKVLSEIKREVRNEALKQISPDQKSVSLRGSDLGQATVNFPKAVLKVPKSTNMEDVKHVLGEDFGLFFEEIVTYKPRKEFETRAVAVENTLHQEILHQSVQSVDPTPSVGFRRNFEA